MSKLRFQSFNFPYNPTEDPRQFLVEFGRTGFMHVFKNDQNIECLPQKKQDRGITYMSKKPTLPLNLPEGNTGSRTPFQTSLDVGYLPKQIERQDDTGFPMIVEQSNIISQDNESQEVRLNKLRYQDRMTKTSGNKSILKYNDSVNNASTCMTVGRQHYGNSLGCSATEDDVVLVYPGGATVSKLYFSKLALKSEKNPPGSFSTLQGQTTHFSLSGPIYEISMMKNCGKMIAARTDNECRLYHIKSSKELLEPRFLGSIKCEQRPCAVAVNPYIPQEVAVCMDKGRIEQWSIDKDITQVAQYSSDLDCHFFEFGGHPRQFIQGNQSNIKLIDIRGKLSSSSQDLVTLPSSHFFHDDKFTAIKRNSDNPYHYVASSYQSLVIFDTRFPQHPVLKWSHSLEYPVKYIDIHKCICSEDMLVFVGCYENSEIHCFQYCYGENNSSIKLGLMNDVLNILPPRVTSNPWKVSSYREWPEVVDYVDKVCSLLTVNQRLHSPLHGLSSISNNTMMTLLQLSTAGDLFYQNLQPCQDNGAGKVNKDINTTSWKVHVELDEIEQKFLVKWVDCLMAVSHAKMKKLKEEYEFKDVSIIQDEILSYLHMSGQCSLCGDNNVCNIDICRRCGITCDVSNTLHVIKTSHCKVPTRKTLGMKSMAIEPLNVFDNTIQCNEALGRNLMINWRSDEQTPINLTE